MNSFYCGQVIEQGIVAALAVVDEQGQMMFWANQEFNWSQARSSALLAQPFLPEPSSEHWVHPQQIIADLQQLPAQATLCSTDALQLQLALSQWMVLPQTWLFAIVPNVPEIPMPSMGRFKEQALYGWRISRLESKPDSAIVKT